MKETNYPEFKKKIRIIRQMCDKLIAESEKEKPNRITISDILSDKVSKELWLAEDIFYRACMPDSKSDLGAFGLDGITECQISNSLLKHKYVGLRIQRCGT